MWGEIMKNNGHAAPLFNGITFQAVSAIYLFLQYLVETDTIKCEGYNDIELHLANGDIIYAQAKSTLDKNQLYKDKNAISKFKKSLKSLEGNNSYAKELIHITNNYNPLNVDKFIFSKKQYCKFKDMPKYAQDIISNQAILTQPEKLTIYHLPFEGSNPCVELEEELKSKLLVYLKEDYTAYSNIVLDKWFLLFMINGRNPNIKLYITKKKLASTLIVLKLIDGFTENELIDKLKFEEEVLSEYDYIYNDYTKNFINSTSLKIDLLGDIQYQWDEYKSKFSGKHRINYINDGWEAISITHSHIFDAFDNQDLREFIIKIVMYVCLKRNRTITRVKEVMGL